MMKPKEENSIKLPTHWHSIIDSRPDYFLPVTVYMASNSLGMENITTAMFEGGQRWSVAVTLPKKRVWYVLDSEIWDVLYWTEFQSILTIQQTEEQLREFKNLIHKLEQF